MTEDPAKLPNKFGIWVIIVKPLSKIKHKDPFIHENRYFDNYNEMYEVLMKLDKFEIYGKRNTRDVIGVQLTKGSLRDVEL